MSKHIFLHHIYLTFQQVIFSLINSWERVLSDSALHWVKYGCASSSGRCNYEHTVAFICCAHVCIGMWGQSNCSIVPRNWPWNCCWLLCSTHIHVQCFGNWSFVNLSKLYRTSLWTSRCLHMWCPCLCKHVRTIELRERTAKLVTKLLDFPVVALQRANAAFWKPIVLWICQNSTINETSINLILRHNLQFLPLATQQKSKNYSNINSGKKKNRVPTLLPFHLIMCM